MKKSILLAAVVLASGCHGGAHAPQAHRAAVSAQGGQLCIALPETRPGEYLRSLNVEDVTGAVQRQVLSYPGNRTSTSPPWRDSAYPCWALPSQQGTVTTWQ
ncbi:hypothetical protein [Pseudomonas sp. KNUC1026]|uniref:hypothetical protein n=1 Tax=Pseudomonas sp. KNUC1026 TaxID=2893890 RepID=UPI001F3469D9|nr:hypothetical protein [Pseudomonas sp. KNUC1026]UFH50641.1 hypothetical protein LN139_05520 [Pseudomonas sp. KNUC1026]